MAEADGQGVGGYFLEADKVIAVMVDGMAVGKAQAPTIIVLAGWNLQYNASRRETCCYAYAMAVLAQ